jgi:phospholipase C
LILQNSTTSYPDTPHGQINFIKQFNKGLMNGWSRTGNATLVYYDATQLPYHYQLASTYGLEDNHFSSMGGPSQPNHLYIFAASSHESSDNPTLTANGLGSPGNTGNWNSAWTCGALHTGTAAPYLYKGTLWSTRASDGTRYFGGTCTNDRTRACVCSCPTGTRCAAATFDASHPCNDVNNCSSVGGSCDNTLSIGGTPGAPCPTITTIADVAEAKLGSNSWAYYSWNAQWNAALQSQQIYFNPKRLAAHVHHDKQFDTDITACTASSCSLASIVFLSPDAATNSEHPPSPIIHGEQWLKTRLTPYFNNPYVYAHSIVFITWDDWGGVYDHVPPPVQDSVPTLGFRVPLLCVGPYCKHKVTHTQMEFASVLKCVESVFGLPSLNSRDASSTNACAGSGTVNNNTDGMINTTQVPIPPL